MTTLLVLGSGSLLYREYELRTAAARANVVLLQDVALPWYKRYVSACTLISMDAKETLISTAHALAARHHIDGVFTYFEPFVEPAAIIANELQLPYNSIACAKRCRDKLVMRQIWERMQVPSARSFLVTSLAEATATAQIIGYPVVVKPRSLSASACVVRVNSPDELAAAYTIANLSPERLLHQYGEFRGIEQGVLLEEYLDGPEISVESIVADGQVQIIAITRKYLGPAPYFEEVGHVIAPNEPLPEEQAIRETVLAAHRALDIRWGATHAEVRLTSQGPRMVELAARLAGGLIPVLVKLATGVDIVSMAIDAALGKPSAPIVSQSKAAAIRFLYPCCNAKVQDVHFLPTVMKLPWLHHLVCAVMPGETVLVPPQGFGSRLCYAVVTGTTAFECEKRLDAIFRLIHVELEPLESDLH